MLFTSPIFIGMFLPFLIIIFYFVGIKRCSINIQNRVLLIASLFFYSWGEGLNVLLLLLDVLLVWLAAILMEKYPKYKKGILCVTCAVVIYILGYYKYYYFFLENIGRLFNVQFSVLARALPLGISFFSFQALSYVIDVYRGEVAEKKYSKVALYVSLFPQLVAGPIVRYESIAKQIDTRIISNDLIEDGIRRFIIGLSKKMILSNSLACVADLCVNWVKSGTEVALITCWLGTFAYTFQIYYDFSGYSDMAIGLGEMFGFQFNENFNYPYCAFSITDFWKRWHISLSSWFRDYIYIPLGGNRHGIKRTILNLFLVWVLTGIWHGANWTFVIWGMLYFVFLTVEKIFKLDKKKAVWTYIYTFFVVDLLWVFFRAESVSDALQYLGNLFGFYNNSIVDEKSIFIIQQWGIDYVLAIICMFPVWNKCKEFLKERNKVIIMDVLYIMLGAIAVTYVIKDNYNPFIYFNF